MISIVKDLMNGTSYSVKFLLENDINKTISKCGIKVRKIFSGLMRAVYLTQTEYKLIVVKSEELKRTPKGKIFALNHRQADDIVLGANVVGKSAYIVFGNPCLAFETSNGLGLWAYGMILMKREDGKPIVVTETDDLIGKLEEYKEIISTIRWELIEEKGLYSRNDITNMDYINFIKGNMKNLQMGSIDIELENGRIQSANQDFFKYFHINNIPWDAWGELLETDEIRRLKQINYLHGI